MFAGDKFMPEMHLKQLGFTYSAFRPITRKRKKKKEYKNLKKEDIQDIFIKIN